MKLSNRTIKNLADALAPEVISYIHEDERYAEFMMELLPDGIQEVMGNLDEELRTELAFSIMDRICFRPVS